MVLIKNLTLLLLTHYLDILLALGLEKIAPHSTKASVTQVLFCQIYLRGARVLQLKRKSISVHNITYATLNKPHNNAVKSARIKEMFIWNLDSSLESPLKTSLSLSQGEKS